VQVAMLNPGLHSFKYMPRSGITGLYGRSIFSFLRKCHIAFHSPYTNLHSYKPWLVFLFTPHLSQHLFLFVLLMIAIVTTVEVKCQ
jgi:hypothetical protein